MTLIFVDFSEAFYSIHRKKMDQILLVYGLSKETIAAIMMLYKNSPPPDRDTDLFDIVTGVLQGDTLGPYLFIIYLDYVAGCPCGVMVKAMDCRNVVNEFVFQSRYYVHFWANTLGKGMNPLILPAMG